MSPTHVEATNYYLSYKANEPPTYQKIDIINGTESFDTTRQITLWTSAEHHPRSVYLHIYNTRDHARVSLDQGDSPLTLPKTLHATIDDQPVDFSKRHRYETTDLPAGKVFRIWFPGDTGEDWDNRDMNLGSAEVTFTLS